MMTAARSEKDMVVGETIRSPLHRTLFNRRTAYVTGSLSFHLRRLPRQMQLSMLEISQFLW